MRIRTNTDIVFGLAAAVLLLVLPAACAGRDAAPTKPEVVLVRAAADGPLADGTPDPRPATFALRVLPEGKGGFQDRIAGFLGDLSADSSIHAVVILPSHPGTAAAVAKVKSARGSLVWILAKSEDEALAAEAAADLVVDLAQDSGADAALDAALARGLCELGRRVATGKASVEDRDEILAALRSSGGYVWKVEYRVDPVTGLKARNHVVVTGKRNTGS